MSSLTYCDLYCDESWIQGSGSFYFGALQCSMQRAEILRKQLRNVKEQYGFSGHEMKWTRVSKAKLPAYMAFAQVFLDDPFSQFIVTEVKRDRTWANWASNEEERFFKSYYVFLRRNMNVIYYKYNIFIDYKDSKWYRWSSLQYALNNGLKKQFEHLSKRNFAHIRAVDSKKDDLLQLVDVLLGAITTIATAPAKTQLSEYIHLRLKDLTRSKKNKFIIGDWTPIPKQKTRKPHAH